MPLQNIAEDEIVDSFDTTDLNTGTRLLGYRTIYGTSSDDNLSISTYSTNATAPNVPGTGRVLGNFYDYSGKRLERALGDIARKAGFGPEAVYKKICVLSQGDWTSDDKKASLLQRHCLKLFEHASSVVDLTRFQAIKRWGDILQDHHEIYVWLFCKRRADVLASVDKLVRNVEILQEVVGSPSDLEILNRTSSLIDCHSVGLKLISLSRGTILMVGRLFEVEWQGLRKFSKEDVEKWDILFQYLLDQTLNTSLSGISQWYIQLWSTQIDNGKLHAQNALQLCHSLRNMVTAGRKISTVRLGTIQSLCEKTYVYLSQLLEFGLPPGLTGGIECELIDGVHKPTAIMTLNDLVRSYNSVIPESSLLLLPGCLKEKIKPLLKNTGNGLQTKGSETNAAVLERIFNRLLDHALFELKDLTYLTELSHRISSNDENARSSALLQLGEILQSIPEVYELMITLGGNETKDRLLEINKSLDKCRFEDTSESKCGNLTNLQSILKCHTIGFEFHRLLLPIRGRPHLDFAEIEKWGASFQYLLESLLDPTISELSWWYIDFWSSQILQGHLHLQFALQSCRTLQCVAEAVDPSHIDRWDALAVLCRKVHEYSIGASDSRTLLLAQGDDFMPCDGVPAHISTILNNLVRTYNHVFSSELDTVPDLTCITMLGSTDPISVDVKEKIRGFLKDLQNVDKIKDISFIKLMFLRSCKKLLRRALSELNDTDVVNKLSNATSFTDGTSRWAILQLGDILQSLPEVYMLLITLGGDEIRDFVERLCKSLSVSGNSTNGLGCYPGILMNLRSLLVCHGDGLWLVCDDMPYVWHSEAFKYIMQTASPDDIGFNETRELFLWYLMDNVTCSPMIFYLTYFTHRIGFASHVSRQRYLFLLCCMFQGALLRNRRNASQENRSAMEELCRSTQSLIIEQLRCSVEYFKGDFTELGHAMRSVYTDLTKSKQAFVDEAEVYLSQSCKLLFDMIVKAGHKSLKRRAIKELRALFENRNVFGWFLSICGPDAEQSISRILEVIDDPQIFDPESEGLSRWYYNCLFSKLEVHKLGVELLAPRHEKLHLEYDDLTKHLPTVSSEPPLTPKQRGRWINAFKTLAAILKYRSHFISISKEDISLFYLANCPLRLETDPVLDTAIALDYCANLHQMLSECVRGENIRYLSRAVYQIHTCLKKRVEYVQRSCTDLAPDEDPTFCGTPFDTPKVVKTLNDLAKLSKEKLGSGALELLPIPDYHHQKGGFLGVLYVYGA